MSNSEVLSVYDKQTHVCLWRLIQAAPEKKLPQKTTRFGHVVCERVPLYMKGPFLNFALQKLNLSVLFAAVWR